MEEIQVGEEAPDFELPCVTGEEKGTFKLAALRGKKNVVLVFYALDWTPTCGSELPAFAADLSKFADHHAQVVGISVDSIPSHTAWQKYALGPLGFPLCSDFYPHGEVIQRYGLLREGPPFPGISNRAVIIVDSEGQVRWKKVYDLPTVPETGEILEALRPLAGWF